MPCCKRLALLLPIGMLAAIGPQTARTAPPQDHPLVGRYEGAELIGRHRFAFDEVAVINGPIVDSQHGPQAPGWLYLEGESTLYYYLLPVQRSTLEVLRNYEAALGQAGFELLYTCSTSNGSCYRTQTGRSANTAPYDFALALDAAPELPRLDSDFIRNYFGRNARYLLARTARPEGAVYASIALAEHDRGNHAFIRVVQTRDIEDGRITVVGADEMQRSLADEGRISLYGIHFAFDRADLKPESTATLDEIERLLRSDPALRLAVVGHTDAQGGDAYNLNLSARRADAVVEALVARGIGAERLSPRGAGASEPVADNATDEGRARNRRVELVRK